VFPSNYTLKLTRLDSNPFSTQNDAENSSSSSDDENEKKEKDVKGDKLRIP